MSSWMWDIIAPGTWLVFGIIGLPVYMMLLGWVLGKPRKAKTAGLGIGILVSLVVSVWTGMYVLQLVIHYVFP